MEPRIASICIAVLWILATAISNELAPSQEEPVTAAAQSVLLGVFRHGTNIAWYTQIIRLLRETAEFLFTSTDAHGAVTNRKFRSRNVVL
jgi:hypothetical protein